MALILDGNGLIQGLDAGGLPSGSVNADSLASTLDLSSKTMTFGNVSASGITFPATQSASSNANTLDDYEEGTWTPSVGGSATYNAQQNGWYVKIGKLVVVSFDISINTIGTGNTQLVGGLPFSANDGGVTNEGSGVSYWANLSSSVYSIATQLSGTNVAFVTTNTLQTTVTNVASVLGNGTRIIATISYRTSS